MMVLYIHAYFYFRAKKNSVRRPNQKSIRAYCCITWRCAHAHVHDILGFFARNTRKHEANSILTVQVATVQVAILYLYFAGEALSFTRGWIEGALESGLRVVPTSSMSAMRTLW